MQTHFQTPHVGRHPPSIGIARINGPRHQRGGGYTHLARLANQSAGRRTITAPSVRGQQQEQFRVKEVAHGGDEHEGVRTLLSGLQPS